MTDSTLQNALRDKVAEFAASDEALKEVVARLSELESLITSHRESRSTLDDASKSLGLVVTSLNPLLTQSADAVRDVAKTSIDFGSTLQSLVEVVSTSIADHIEKSRIQIESLTNRLSELESNVLDSNKSTTKRILIAQGIAAICILVVLILK